MTQGEIIAGAIAASATVETDSITIDPDKLLELQARREPTARPDECSRLDFPINPERVAPVLRRLVSPTHTRARIYDRDGICCSIAAISIRPRRDRCASICRRSDEQAEPARARLDRIRDLAQPRRPAGLSASSGRPTARAIPEVAARADRARSAASCASTSAARSIVSVAVPIQRFRAVLGALLLSTQGGDIDKIVAAERQAILHVFGVARAGHVLLSMLLACTIAEPLRRLADAAERVRRGIKTRDEIPDFTDRRDEIGHLSGALRDMTNALYNRIEAIESFAADVAHELKNPLTSLRSAVETLPLAERSETSRAPAAGGHRSTT